LKFPEVITTSRTNHDHTLSEDELGMNDTPLIVGNDEMLLETESFAKPIDRRHGVSIT
jgi:hypothetical protein